MDTDLYQMVTFFADLMEQNFILSDVKELQGKKVHVISHHEVSKQEAYEAFLSALQVSGYTTTTSGNVTKVIKAQGASKTPISVRGVDAGAPGASDGFVTQLIQLANVNVNDVNKVVTTMTSAEAQVVAYAPTNTLIITDTGSNLRKIYKVLQDLDIAAPKSSLIIYPIAFAEAAEVKRIIEELYGTEAEDSSSQTSRASSSRTSRSSRRPSSRTAAAEAATDSVSAGAESKYISKVIDDERTNSLIVLANDKGHEAVIKLIGDIDVDVDARGQIHVVYLEHAKAEEVSQVLSELAQDSGNRSRNAQTNPRNARREAAAARAGGDAAGGGDQDGGSAAAVFDSGMRIAADENTNSLIIIANADDFTVINSVIQKLDIIRKQVFVDAVILELSSDDSFDLGLAAHLPSKPSADATGIIGTQFGTNSLGLTQDLLSGLAVGVFGESVQVPFANPTGGTTLLDVPAFGIVLNALKTNSSVNIVSNPNILTLDNEEAEIVVGRRIPFPTTAGLNNLGQPVTSFQREDVAITLKITPRVNSSDYVTLEVEIEVQEIEEDDQGLNVQQSGFITSKREEKTTVLIKDNQTVVLGGLVGATDTEVETKFPILGDVPIIGALFRGRRVGSRKTNLMIFLTPHIIDDDRDMLEVQRIKEAQRQEFLRRFYGKSKDTYLAEMRALLRFSKNYIDEPSMFRGPTMAGGEAFGDNLSDETRNALIDALDEAGAAEPGSTAGDLPDGDEFVIFDDEESDEIIDDGPLPDAPSAEEN